LVPELGGHDVVQDGVDGRVDVEHQPGKVELKNNAVVGRLGFCLTGRCTLD